MAHSDKDSENVDGNSNLTSAMSETDNSVSLEAYKLLEARFNCLQAQYDEVVNIQRAAPQPTPVQFFEHRSNSQDEDSDSDSTSSIELDENFERKRTTRQDSLGALGSFGCSIDSNSTYDSGNLNGASGIHSTGGARSTVSMDTSHISPELFTRIVMENRRLKRTLAHDRSRWNQDNSVGLDTIKRLQGDVAENKHKLTKQAEKHEKEMQELKEKQKEKNALMKQQMQVFKDDFEKERDARNNAVAKLKQLAKHMERLKEQNEVLKSEKDRLKSENNQYRQIYGRAAMAAAAATTLPRATTQMPCGAAVATATRPRAPTQMSSGMRHPEPAFNPFSALPKLVACDSAGPPEDEEPAETSPRTISPPQMPEEKEQSPRKPSESDES